MLFGIKSANPVKTRAQCVMIGIYEGADLSPTAKIIDQASEGYIKESSSEEILPVKLVKPVSCMMYRVSVLPVSCWSVWESKKARVGLNIFRSLILQSMHSRRLRQKIHFAA